MLRDVEKHRIATVVGDLRREFDAGHTHSPRWRQRQLTGLLRFCYEQRTEILRALSADLGKPAQEAMAADVLSVGMEIASLKFNLKRYLRPQKVATPLMLKPAASYIHKDALGVVLIIGAWNYPVQLTLIPLAGAIAAGNCAVVKPSEIAPHTSALLASRLGNYIDSDCIRVVEGGADETETLLAQRFDHIFYTGNGTIGRVVMNAASENLTPVTLELGGKSPCIVDCKADLEVSARRIALGKFMNAGQTCIAPDYVLVHRQVESELLDRLKATIHDFYGSNPQSSKNYARIVNERHFERVSRFLKDGELVAGGESDRSDLYIAPTVTRNVAPESPSMSEEIFGPVLPVLSVDSIDEALAFVRGRPKPLACYLFTRDKHMQHRAVKTISSGGMCINHTVMHAGNPSLPFGGVGPSGMGSYHGRRTFETFVHNKAVLKKPFWLDAGFIYPKSSGERHG